jgi:citrate lyase alpha subunit
VWNTKAALALGGVAYTMYDLQEKAALLERVALQESVFYYIHPGVLII